MALFHRLAGLATAGGCLLRYGAPARSLLFGPLSLGDDLLCTAVLREARKRNRPFAMMTSHPELFAHNDDPARLLPINAYHAEALRRLGCSVVKPYYVKADPDRPERDILPPRHIIAEMCRAAGISGEVLLRPYLRMTDLEVRVGGLFPRQIAIQSTSLSAALPYSTKEWGPQRFAEVARRLSGDFQLVQLGTSDDPPLPVAADLRGKTSLREAAAILAASEIFVGLEGFLAHLARAVDCPSVLILGGRATPATFGYSCNTNLYNPVDCSPCGLREGCPYDMKCMMEILHESVAGAARELVARRLPRPLAAESCTLP